MLNTTVTLTGSSQVALARNPRGRGNTAVARREPARSTDARNKPRRPIVLTPRPAIFAPRPVSRTCADDGYIYPADGTMTAPRYPAPRRLSPAV